MNQKTKNKKLKLAPHHTFTVALPKELYEVCEKIVSDVQSSGKKYYSMNNLIYDAVMFLLEMSKEIQINNNEEDQKNECDGKN